MSTINEYLKWRGDLTFNISPINEIDLVLLSQIPLLHLETIIDNDTIISFEDLLDLYYKKYNNKEIGLIIPGTITEALHYASKQFRFKDLIIKKYIKIIDEDKEEQFCAVTIDLTDEISYIIYCATDDTIIGWKENLNLILNKETNAQLDSLDYINKLENEGTIANKKIYIGGHSKGGNLSIYAGTLADDSIKNKIINIYNFDGPGFNEYFFEQDKYKIISDKVIEILPIDSVVGCLFSHKGKQIIVNSNARGLMQHNVLTWLVDKTKFELIETTSYKAKHVDQKIKHLVESMDDTMKQDFINAVYRILSANNNKLLITLKQNKIAIAKAYLNSSKEEKKIILKLLNYLVRDGIIRNGLINGLIELDRFKRALKKRHKKENKKRK